MSDGHEFIKKVGPDAKEIESKAPWLANLKKIAPWLWSELEDFLEAPREFVLIKLLDQTADPWMEHYPNRVEALKMIWEIGERYIAETEAKTEAGDGAEG